MKFIWNLFFKSCFISVIQYDNEYLMKIIEMQEKVKSNLDNVCFLEWNINNVIQLLYYLSVWHEGTVMEHLGKF